MMPRSRLMVLAAAILGGAGALALDIGDTAPAIQVKTWLSGTPLTPEATKGKVLVVDFWATWCQPCRQTVPHLNRLHKKYAGKDVVFIGITEEDEAAVKKYMGTTLMEYRVGLDDRGRTNDGYMKNVPGIPHAFVVDRDGRVAWHGHPMARMERAIEELVAGKFDLARAKKLAALREKLAPFIRARDNEKVLAVLDETLKAVPDDAEAYRLKRLVLRDQGKIDETWEVLYAMAKGCPRDPDVLLEVALTLGTTGELERRDLPRAIELAKQAAEVAGEKAPGAHAALARIHYELGHVALAAEVAAKAAASAEGEEKKTLEAHAAFYRKEAERRRKDPDAK